MTNTPTSQSEADRAMGYLSRQAGVKVVRPLECSDTAMHALKLCTRLALSERVRGRDAYLDRLEQMSADELAEHAYACEELS